MATSDSITAANGRRTRRSKVSNGGDNQGWKNWNDLSPGQLKHEIEAAFNNAPSGVYQALEVRIENPIREYRVISPTT
jgi:hypothetical protein